MEICETKIPSIMLRRGFWIYVVRIFSSGKYYFYIGMTGDTGSPNAASLFSRLGRHLDGREKAKSNSLFKALRKQDLWKANKFEFDDFEIIGFYLSVEDKKDHSKVRGEISHLEDRLHKDLEKGGQIVLGSQWKKIPQISLEWEKRYEEILEQTKHKFNLTF